MDRDTSFEHGETFEQGEVSGNVRIGKLEAHYADLYSDVIEDGVITVAERERLDRMADALGLDKARLRALEDALAAVYEAKQRVRIVDLSAEEQGPASLVPVSPASDPHAAALERRIQHLLDRIEALEKELAEARAQVSVEVDVSGVVGTAEDDVEALQRRLAHDPRDPATLRALFKAFTRAGDVDRQLGVAHALVFLGEAGDAERAVFEEHRTRGLIKPARSLDQDAWRRLLAHPDEEPLVGEIFAAVAGPVLLGRVAALKRDKQLPAIDPAKRQHPKISTLQAVRCFAWAASLLGTTAPTLYADLDAPGVVTMQPALPPCAILGRDALSGRSPAELAFAAGRHLAWYREERFLRLLVPGVPDLEDLFLTALFIGNPGLPLRPDVKRRVAPLAQAIEPILEPAAIDKLRALFLRFVEEGGRANLQRWAAAADHTAARAGLLLSDDLAAAKRMLEAEDPDPGIVTARVDDLLAFLGSERWASLRKQLGVAAR